MKTFFIFCLFFGKGVKQIFENLLFFINFQKEEVFTYALIYNMFIRVRPNIRFRSRFRPKSEFRPLFGIRQNFGRIIAETETFLNINF